MATTDTDDTLAPPSGGWVRVVWWVVWVLAALMLLAGMAVASTAILSPDAFVDPCRRPQLLTPLSCGSADPAP